MRGGEEKHNLGETTSELLLLFTYVIEVAWYFISSNKTE
jgi:hypothetical protein